MGPDNKLNPAKIAFMREFNWEKVATINQALEFFSLVRVYLYTVEAIVRHLVSYYGFYCIEINKNVFKIFMYPFLFSCTPSPF